MALARGAMRVPPLVVLLLGLLVGSAAAVTLVLRGTSPDHLAAPASVATPAAAAEQVRFVPGEQPTSDLPPPAPDRQPEPEPTPEPEPEPAPEPEPEPEVDEPAAERPGDVQGRTTASPLPLLDREALAATAERVRIPERALAAYASAALLLREEQPTCNLTWVTLAGVGYVESHHGTIGDRQLRADGRPSEPIIGVALDGGPNVRAIRDSDGGRYDGDPSWDRAVGPMQFIPSTWARWGADGSGDGKDDPQHIDDAALAAARYLCASDRDLSAGGNWGEALWSYNRSESYIRHVHEVANAYAARANGS